MYNARFISTILYIFAPRGDHWMETTKSLQRWDHQMEAIKGQPTWDQQIETIEGLPIWDHQMETTIKISRKGDDQLQVN